MSQPNRLASRYAAAQCVRSSASSEGSCRASATSSLGADSGRAAVAATVALSLLHWPWDSTPRLSCAEIRRSLPACWVAATVSCAYLLLLTSTMWLLGWRWPPRGCCSAGSAMRSSAMSATVASPRPRGRVAFFVPRANRFAPEFLYQSYFDLRRRFAVRYSPPTAPLETCAAPPSPRRRWAATLQPARQCDRRCMAGAAAGCYLGIQYHHLHCPALAGRFVLLSAAGLRARVHRRPRARAAEH